MIYVLHGLMVSKSPSTKLSLSSECFCMSDAGMSSDYGLDRFQVLTAGGRIPINVHSQENITDYSDMKRLYEFTVQ